MITSSNAGAHLHVLVNLYRPHGGDVGFNLQQLRSIELAEVDAPPGTRQVIHGNLRARPSSLLEGKAGAATSSVWLPLRLHPVALVKLV